MEHRVEQTSCRMALRVSGVVLACAMAAFGASEVRRLDDGVGAASVRQDVRSAPVRGRALDRDTGEPIASLALVVDGVQGASEAVETDASGRFETQRAFAAGPLRIVRTDLAGDAQAWDPTLAEEVAIRREHVPGAEGRAPELELQLSIGPTYALDLELPEGVALKDLAALFPHRTKGLRLYHRLAAEDPNSPMGLFMGAIESPRSLEEHAPLRSGTPAWVRFRSPIVPEALPRLDAQRVLLHVRSRDGRWAGSVAVPALVGVHRDPLRVELVRCGAIEGRVLDATGEPVPTAWVQRLDDASPDGVLEELGADQGGAFRFDALRPGEQLLRVETERYSAWTGRVDVRSGATTPVEVVLTAPRPLASVSGALRSRTGRHRSKGGIVSLKSTADPQLYFLRNVTWREVDGELAAPFEFADVPQGEYVLELRPIDNRRWESLRQVVVAPAEDLEFLCLDEGPTLELGFRAVDARDGTSLARANAILWHGEPVEELRLDDDWETGRYLGVPADSALTWVVRADGYQLAWGDDGAIPDEGDPRVVETRLAPGWGQVFKVTTRERDPLEGVELVVDGASVGRTDAQGLIAVSRDRLPTSLAFRREGWHVTWGRVDPAADGFDQGIETPVYLDRD